jgi:hypothetical protein
MADTEGNVVRIEEDGTYIKCGDIASHERSGMD